MAHVVGVPKRDPCSACGLPVFLAERLTIPSASANGAKKVYHRTCLKCARCKSQLSPGSFYETEVDGEYCCETCPDEEKVENMMKLPEVSVSKETLTPTPSASGTTSRGSIADRLAFFENDGRKLLQKSLSDEEKSQSLQKISESQKSVFKRNVALNKFMSSHLTDSVDSGSASPDRSQSNLSSRRSSASTTSSTSSIVEDDVSEKAPELPKSLPPSTANISPSKTPEKSITTTSTTFKSSMNLSLGTTDTPHAATLSSKIPTYSKRAVSDNIKKSDPEDQLSKDTQVQTQSTVEISTKTSLTDANKTDQTNVTKDISDTDEKMRTSATAKATTPATSSLSLLSSLKDSSEKFDDVSQTNRSNMVRARLHQFEIISSNSNSPTSSISSNISNPSDKGSNIEHNHNQDDSMSIEIDSAGKPSLDDNPTPEINKIEANNTTIETEVPKIVIKDIPEISLDDAKIEDSSFKNSCEKLKLQETESIADASYPNEEHNSIDKNVIEMKIHEMDSNETLETTSSSRKSSNVNLTEEYPEDLNPFQSDEEETNEDVKKRDPHVAEKSDSKSMKDEKRHSLNPFDSSDDEVEYTDDSPRKVKPPRPPPPKLKSTNPFDSDDDDGEEEQDQAPKSIESTKRRPIPTPRSHLTSSQNTTPEPTPRLSRQVYNTPLSNSSEQYESTPSLSYQSAGLNISSEFLRRESDVRGSSHSITSSTGSLSGGKYKKGKKAPLPPKQGNSTVKELFPPTSLLAHKVSPQLRKKRPAPAPPPVSEETTFDTHAKDESMPTEDLSGSASDLPQTDDVKSGDDKLSDEEKLKEAVLLTNSGSEASCEADTKTTRRLISFDASLLEDEFNGASERHPKEDEYVVYRRTIAPLVLNNLDDDDGQVAESHDRQLEKLKDNKEAKNRNRQSQTSLSIPIEETDPLFNKSVHGKWRRRKGPAPALPVPPRKVLQMLPLQEIRHELEIIEVQQQGLEKQGVMLEKMIRERCEGDTSVSDVKEEETSSITSVVNSKEVEDLIMQLFELVNEKNELFRRQAELMYLRRQHRLEQEQADLEYEIRVLMAQPERNKTDSDKAREEALIGRLVEVVQLRNEVIECLEMDRLREAEEDMSIKQRLEMHAAKRDEELCNQTPTKLSKKEKKRQKELKKLGKSKKIDADKDADESELATVDKKEKKKKKNLLSSVIAFNK